MSNETMKYDRPFITYKDQIDKLRIEYGLIIEDESFAVEALSTISYYDLINGYQECFKQSGKYFDGITIEYLYNFYLFDKSFQNIFIKHSLLIENIFKTKLSYIIAKNLGVDVKDYLNPKYYKKPQGKLDSDKILNKFRSVYQNKIEYVDNPTRHYLVTKNHIPPWILFKNVKFVNIIDLFSILGVKEKFELVNELIPSQDISYDRKVEHIRNSLTIIRKFRNKIAHNLKFITYDCDKFSLSATTVQQLCPLELISNNEHFVDNNYQRVYKFFLAIVTFYNNNPYMLNRFLFDTLVHLRLDTMTNKNKTTFNDYHIITNLPPDLENRVENYIVKISSER